MNDPLSKIKQHFKSINWRFVQDDHRPLLRLGVDLEHGLLMECIAVIEGDEKHFAFYSLFPVEAPVRLRPAVAELVTRINFCLRCGGFELDWSHGMIAMKTSTTLYGESLPDEAISSVIGLNIQTMAYFSPAFMKVLYFGAEPEAALMETARPSRFMLN